ncbi:hypothetical protein PLESTB_000426900 [Pleodorina starrii]|uniref:Protein kinase domain-containing protein n=1 Tax=Pleodorina starrii TaxID=330485 RepID=A0A9W6BEH8_9CHLO|nr:hypothetical protein PLESTM_001697200 [Pleodorina starrii]GLC50741.1 hypothetical protein PLESTB_000426900 [Pleodorina starrii]GLC74353.1 hypothetical protein PLESTF_001502700 [Pleodorina starrii]
MTHCGTFFMKLFRACFGKARLPKEDAGGARCKPAAISACEMEICQPATPKLSTAGQRPYNAPPVTSGDGQGLAGPVSRASVAADGASGPRTCLNAARLQEMDAENVVICDASKIMDGLRLRQHELGRGTYGIVVTGTYRGVSCAVKVMLSAGGLDRAALRELLLGPSLVHPNIVSTIASRAAHLTDEFFDLLEGDSAGERDSVPDRNRPRVLEPLPINSGDGFGDPKGLNDGPEPLLVLHQILHALGAETGRMVVIVVQEYCDSGTLDRAIRKKVFEPRPMWGLRLARRTLLRTAGDIARGLLHLHDAGVVHGDLKPANVLLSSSREDRRGFSAKLADFGLSHVLPGAVTSLVTRTWGSIAYMAPEAFSGKVSRATDVWAFGVVLWELLKGTRPYMGMGQNEVIEGVKDNTLTLLWPDAMPMAEPIIALGRRCLSHDPEGRPTFVEIVGELVAIERAIRAELLGVPEADPPATEATTGDDSGPDIGLEGL